MHKTLHRPVFLKAKQNMLRWYPQQPQRFIFTNLSEACGEAKRWKYLSWVSVYEMVANPVEPNLALHQSLLDLLRNLCWTWPGSAPKNLLRNPVEPDMALHQSLPDLLRNLFRNLVEPDLALHQSLPDLPRNLLRNLLRNPRWTWPGACTSAHRSYSELKTPLAYAVGEKHCKLQHVGTLIAKNDGIYTVFAISRKRGRHETL